MFERVLNTPLPTISKLREISNLQKPEVTVQRCSENIQQITLRHECSPVICYILSEHLLVTKNTSGQLLLQREGNTLSLVFYRITVLEKLLFSVKCQ